jgi:pentatricopeptide repeat protein
LNLLVVEAQAPLSRQFAKIILEAFIALKEVDLAFDVFEKVAECDATMLRKMVEKASTNPSGCSSTASKDEALLAQEIRTCGKNGDLQGALKIFEQQHGQKQSSLFYNSVLEACVACGNVDKAVEVLKQAKKDGVADIVSYNIVIKGHMGRGNIAAAMELLADISLRGLSATHASFHVILSFLASAGDRMAMWKLVEDMQSAGVYPNGVTCTILLRSTQSTSSDVDKVLKLLSKIEEPVDEALFAALAEACIRTKKFEVLARHMPIWAGQGSPSVLTAATFGSMIKAFGQIHDVERVKELWVDMLKRDVQPTAITLGCMIDALVMNRCTSDAWELAKQLRNDDNTAQLVNTVVYSTIIKGFANSKDTDKVMALYGEMKARDIRPNNITYNTILNAFAEGGAMHRLPALLEDMKSAVPPAEPDIVTYSTIIKGYCNNGNVERALSIVKDMQDEGNILPDEVMYNSLLDGCAKEQRLDDALKLLDDMKRTGVAPSNYTLNIMVKLLGRCRRLKQALSLVEEISHEYNLRINIQVYTCLMQACFNNRQAAKACSLHDQLIADGLTPDEMIYSALVKGCLQANMVDKAVHFVKCAHGVAAPKAHNKPPGVNAYCLDSVISALGGAQNVNAKSLLSEIGKSAASSGTCKGSDGQRSKAISTAPWRQQRV